MKILFDFIKSLNSAFELNKMDATAKVFANPNGIVKIFIEVGQWKIQRLFSTQEQLYSITQEEVLAMDLRNMIIDLNRTKTKEQWVSGGIVVVDKLKVYPLRLDVIDGKYFLSNPKKVDTSELTLGYSGSNTADLSSNSPVYQEVEFNKLMNSLN